jgi:hypothetical protein
MCDSLIICYALPKLFLYGKVIKIKGEVSKNKGEVSKNEKGISKLCVFTF